jgi:polysaccharide export outer membrane protein
VAPAAKNLSAASHPLAGRSGIGWVTAAMLVLPQLAPLTTLAAPPPPPTKRAAPAPLQRARVTYDTYLLGPGDSLQIELENVPELSGIFTIGPDGTLYLPRLRALLVEGLSVEELRIFLTQQYRAFVRQPEIYLRPVGYRPVRIYVGGEVRRPGYYTLSGSQQLGGITSAFENQYNTLEGSPQTGGAGNAALNQTAASSEQAYRRSVTIRDGSASTTGISGSIFPTVFDAIRTAQGITPYSDLSVVQVTRKQPQSNGGGKLRTSLNFLSLITNGDESQNIRLFDGDVVSVAKSPIVLREQLLKAGQSNLSPQFIQVYVSGRVKMPGATTIPQGASLNQALISAGGQQLLHGKIEFVRFTREGELDRRVFSYNPNAATDTLTNPILVSGDIIRVQESPLSAGIGLLNELTGPFVGVYSVYSLFGGVR